MSASNTNVQKLNRINAVTVDHIIAGITDDIVTRRIGACEAISTNMISVMEINALSENLGVDLTKKICRKTGLVLENRPHDYVAKAIKVYGQEYAVELLRRENISSVALHWLKTGPRDLDKLIVLDPRSYFVYAAGYVCANYSPLADFPGYQLRQYQAKGTKSERYTEVNIAEYEWVFDKYKLRNMLEQVDLPLIIRINETMRRWLTCFETAKLKEFDKGWAEQLYTDEYETILPAIGNDPELFLNLLQNTMQRVVLKEVDNGVLSYSADYDQIARLNSKYGQYANFSQQFNPKGLTKVDKLKSELVGIMVEADIPDDTLHSTQRANIEIIQGRIVKIDANFTKANVSTQPRSFSFTVKPKE